MEFLIKLNIKYLKKKVWFNQLDFLLIVIFSEKNCQIGSKTARILNIPLSILRFILNDFRNAKNLQGHFFWVGGESSVELTEFYLYILF